LSARPDEPDPGGKLKREDDAECNLIGDHRVTGPFDRPTVDDDANEFLNEKRPADVEYIHCRVGASSQFLGEIVSHDRVAQDRRGADGGHEAPWQVGWQRPAQDQRDLHSDEQCRNGAKNGLRLDIAPTQAGGEDSEQEGANAERHGHREKMADERRTIEAFDIAQPRRRP